MADISDFDVYCFYLLSQSAAPEQLQSRHTTYRESTFCLGINFLKKIVKFRWLMVHKNRFFLKSTKKVENAND